MDTFLIPASKGARISLFMVEYAVNDQLVCRSGLTRLSKRHRAIFLEIADSAHLAIQKPTEKHGATYTII